VVTSAQLPIRVMRVITRMNVGGPAMQVTGLMSYLDNSTFEQTLYAGYCGEDELDYLSIASHSFNVVRVKGLARSLSPLNDLRAFLFLVREIRKVKPHIIHTHTAKAGLIGRMASIFSGHRSKRVHTFHGHLLHGYFSRARRNTWVFIERVLAKFTHQLLGVGTSVMQDLLEVGVGVKSKFRVMPPGVSLGTLLPKDQAKHFFGLSQDRLQCALIGRVTKIKRPDRFLDVVLEIEKRGLAIDFVVVGNGDLFEICKDRIHKQNMNVKLLGWQTEIEKVLSAVDIVILTSDNEGMPISLIQAGMAGIPVVATNVGSVNEVVLNQITGITTIPEVNSLANALEFLANNDSVRSNFGRKALQHTGASFSVVRLVLNHEELYRALTST
jgi:glycosyltransferase involved in cell wall biosynthesis